jgi:glycosyltransferase involved in cell wall biosynthesis
MPRISVILPVYNAQAYLNDALQSIFMQSYQDFEIIAINDGSTDRSGELLDRYKDKRLKVIHQQNRGLAETLNMGIQLASGEFIARQDSDDMSLPERFAQQINYFDQHPNCGLLGTQANIWHHQQKTKRMIQYPCDNAKLQLLGMFNCLFVHSSVMARKEMIFAAGYYPLDSERNPPEDFDLWLRMMEKCEVANLDKPYLIYREVKTGITQTNKNLIQERTHHIACEHIANFVNVANDVDIHDLVAIVRYDPERLSNKVNWNQCQLLLDQMFNSLLLRFPKEANRLKNTKRKLQLNVQMTRIARSFLNQKNLKKVYTLLRYFKNRA